MLGTFATNLRNLQIKTADGYVDFAGVRFQGHKHVWRITFADDTSIDVSGHHVFFTPDDREISTKELNVGIVLKGTDGNTKQVTNIAYHDKIPTYDVIGCETETYASDGVISHNCEFLSSDALLISSLVLNEIKVDELPPPDAQGVHWFEQLRDHQTLLIGIDPSTGSGSDVSSIEMYDFPSLRQVAEFRSNTTSSAELYKVLKYLLKRIATKRNTTVYYSVENNGIGEGIIALYDNDENPPEGHFVSEEGRNRLGMTTTGKSKMKACINLKELITKGRLRIRSKILLAELKAFTRRLGTYSAQRGSTDDSVAATLVVMRILEEIATFEDKAHEMLYQMVEYSVDDEVDNALFGKNDEDESDEESTGAESAHALVFEGMTSFGHLRAKGAFTDPNDPDSFDPFGV